jgi:LCP family protein required for cell wall assembly
MKKPWIKLTPASAAKAVVLMVVVMGIMYAIRFVISVAFVVNVMALLPVKENHGINVLVVGIDEVEGTQRSDAISVVHINQTQNKIRALSIPRDTRVTIEGVGVSKINHAYAYGGIGLLSKTVSEFLSIPIHNTIVINSEGIKALIDEVGGVTIDVEEPMQYDDYAGNLHINFKAGKTHLNGEDLLKYVRFRNNAKGDIGRIERQQEISTLLFNKIFRIQSLAISPKLIGLFFKSVKTDLSIGQMNNYLHLFLKKRDALSIKYLTVPGSVRLIDGVSYWRPDIVYLDNLISKTFVDYDPNENSTDPPQKKFLTTQQIRRVKQQLALDKPSTNQHPVIIEVLNGNGKNGLATQTAQFLRKKNLVVSKVSNSQSFDYKHTVIVDWKGNLEKSLYLSKLLNIDASNIVVYNRQDKPLDITLVLGKNWSENHIEGH